MFDDFFDELLTECEMIGEGECCDPRIDSDGCSVTNTDDLIGEIEDLDIIDLL